MFDTAVPARATVATAWSVSLRPSTVQITPGSPHAPSPGDSVTVTASSDEGATVISHSALLPFTRLALRTAPFPACTAVSRSVR